jgi:hypothetical protein
MFRPREAACRPFSLRIALCEYQSADAKGICGQMIYRLKETKRLTYGVRPSERGNCRTRALTERAVGLPGRLNCRDASYGACHGAPGSEPHCAVRR